MAHVLEGIYIEHQIRLILKLVLRLLSLGLSRAIHLFYLFSKVVSQHPLFSSKLFIILFLPLKIDWIILKVQVILQQYNENVDDVPGFTQ